MCEALGPGATPVISGGIALDAEYLDRFREMTDLAARTEITRQAIPAEAGSAANFMVRGLRALRAQMFGMPVLVDQVAEQGGTDLNPIQHRKAVDRALRGFFPQYYAPTFPMIEMLGDALIVDRKSHDLDPAKFTFSGGPDDFIIYPRPEVIEGVNASFVGFDLPVETACPAFAGRAPAGVGDKPDKVVPIPRSLNEIAFEQWDRWYYPQKKREYSSQS